MSERIKRAKEAHSVSAEFVNELEEFAALRNYHVLQESNAFSDMPQDVAMLLCKAAVQIDFSNALITDDKIVFSYNMESPKAADFAEFLLKVMSESESEFRKKQEKEQENQEEMQSDGGVVH